MAPSTRNSAVDFARGIAIILVVIGHTWRGLDASGLIPDQSLFQFVDQAIYLFHMPLFFMLAGYFFERLMQRPAPKFLKDRVIRLLYPMVIWTWLFALAKLGMGAAANAPMSLAEFPFIPLPPKWQFWFLWALFGIQILAYVFGKIGQSTLWWVAITLACVVAYQLAIAYDLKHWAFATAASNLPFFVAGLLLHRHGHLLSLPIAAPFAAFLACQAFIWAYPPELPLIEDVFSLIAAISAFAICLWLAPKLPAAFTKAIGYLGLSSMVIYLAHTFFAAPVRIVLLKLDLHALGLHLFAATLAGLIFPLLLAFVLQRLKLSKVFGI